MATHVVQSIRNPRRGTRLVLVDNVNIPESNSYRYDAAAYILANGGALSDTINFINEFSGWNDTSGLTVGQMLQGGLRLPDQG